MKDSRELPADTRCAVVIPCYNEEMTIGKVIRDVRAVLPQAEICVFDNNSTDRTVQQAREAGAKLFREKRQGKGFVIQSMFSKVEADIYVMVDGDDTYDLHRLPEMVAKVERDQADMVVGSRLSSFTKESFRPLHTFGNRLVAWLIDRFFGGSLTDIMSGLRVMNRDFVKNINITAAGFEVETEMTIKALKHNAVISEMAISYRERPQGSFSKLNTYRDGILVLRTILMIFKDYKPFLFFAGISLLLFILSLFSGAVVITEFLKTRYITHVPLAILASGLMILSMIFFITGVILDCTNRRFDEMYHFMRQKGAK
ncbi:MAG: glycosyltransferase family 2 protein [Oryzomonas sp.]|uniref:glycosyltransferase family 2 protein n=1 Tax=Oryzomonas sp. TaxID=2855186 RepID=UPI00283C04BC|nr:glycosyltransferase family 2 protein [Oryzomonas sp.]MDR3581011.1 glycosyltransferase family 2 protein [Oryzomonas sp.]